MTTQPESRLTLRHALALFLARLGGFAVGLGIAWAIWRFWIA